MQIHATCVARHGRGMLLLGPSGSGKSDLALRLIGRGFALVADDRVEIEAGAASPADGLAGLLEVRGIGIVCLAYEAPVLLALAMDLASVPERHPASARHPLIDVPLIAFDPREVSAAEKAGLAFDCALGRANCLSGALAR